MRLPELLRETWKNYLAMPLWGQLLFAAWFIVPLSFMIFADWNPSGSGGGWPIEESCGVGFWRC